MASIKPELAYNQYTFMDKQQLQRFLDLLRIELRVEFGDDSLKIEERLPSLLEASLKLRDSLGMKPENETIPDALLNHSNDSGGSPTGTLHQKYPHRQIDGLQNRNSSAGSGHDNLNPSILEERASPYQISNQRIAGKLKDKHVSKGSHVDTCQPYTSSTFQKENQAFGGQRTKLQHASSQSHYTIAGGSNEHQTDNQNLSRILSVLPTSPEDNARLQKSSPKNRSVAPSRAIASNRTGTGWTSLTSAKESPYEGYTLSNPQNINTRPSDRGTMGQTTSPSRSQCGKPSNQLDASFSDS
ncbi:hypothetical protein BS50DRAFT_211518 [Corynespora cassiicola Philippines]|uniref:Uncharacterized protein n=1 Tax=Corynespora cassiicola Philippines TaxID=1448308 RepID=A0A2T2N437_CORCC|nr:hypothetical protein BS50DRAFT_211518 [Corynespora cassiicola Philippines]